MKKELISMLIFVMILEAVAFIAISYKDYKLNDEVFAIKSKIKILNAIQEEDVKDTNNANKEYNNLSSSNNDRFEVYSSWEKMNQKLKD